MDPALLREALRAIKLGAEEQRELIEDLVDTARIATGKLSLSREPADLNTVAESALASIETIAAEQGLKIESQFAPAVGRVDIDPLRIRQVVSNLLSNAVKFTDAGGKISLEIRRRGDEVEIEIADTGQGFTAEFQSQLFTRFQQASHESSRAHGGLGIGLSIVKQIVLLHGGTITGESPGVGQGATFTVVIPLPPLRPAVIVNPPASTGRAKITPVLRGCRVLVVEDSPETLRALAAVLHEAGATVVTAGSAPAALARFEQERPDLIVSDVGLPEINGYQFIAQLREAERARSLTRVPALALTAFAGEDTARKALRSGFQQCLSKPIEPVELVTALAELKARLE